MLIRVDNFTVCNNFQVAHINFVITEYDSYYIGSSRRSQIDYTNIDAVVFLVDATDTARFEEAALEFQVHINSNQLRSCD